MSQELIPVDGGVVTQVVTTIPEDRLNVLSPQYVQAERLENRLTQWNPLGRPIYRRLPAASESYQIDFFNVVRESNVVGNTFVDPEIDRIGYVYVPFGVSLAGPGSCAVVAAEGNGALLVQAGEIVWEYGKTEVLPAIIDLSVLDIGSGRYDISYQLIYDDAPVAKLYQVEDFSLCGLPLDISSSTDDIVGWRYVPVNAFLNESSVFWSSEDSDFPSYAQPASSYLRWESELPQAYSNVTLRCPIGTAYSGTATLSYLKNGELTEVVSVSPSKDSTGQFFEFSVVEPNLQTGWNVAFSDLNVSIQEVTVSGTITLEKAPSSPVPRAQLAIFAQGLSPQTTVNSLGEVVPVTYCPLATFDVNNFFEVTDIDDDRSIIQRDFEPVADWLTKPFDDDLIDLYGQVSEYPTLWMAPETCMKQEYVELETDQIQVEK